MPRDPRPAAAPLELSVIIPCYNAAGTLPQTLASLFDQSGAGRFEVIVADNGSTDGLQEVLEASTPPSFVDLRLVDASARRGAAYARNVGAATARSDRLAFCDADDVVSVWWVKHILMAFEETELWSGSAVATPERAFSRSVAEVRALIWEEDIWKGLSDEQLDAPFPVLMGGNCGMTADVFRRIGGFDAAAPEGGEDNEFALRASRLGYPIHVVPSIRIAYRQREEPRALRALARRSAIAHARLARQYGLAGRSPYGHWAVCCLRTAASLHRVVRVPAPERGTALEQWRLRWASAVGLAIGRFTPRRRRDLAIGAGFDAQPPAARR